MCREAIRGALGELNLHTFGTTAGNQLSVLNLTGDEAEGGENVLPRRESRLLNLRQLVAGLRDAVAVGVEGEGTGDAVLNVGGTHSVTQLFG